MKIVYIAGPYSGLSAAIVMANISAARQAAIRLAEAGIGYFCPHLNSVGETPSVPESFWRELGLAMLISCDAVLMLEDWEKSKGAREELVTAAKARRRVFYMDGPGGSDWDGLLAWAKK